MAPGRPAVRLVAIPALVLLLLGMTLATVAQARKGDQPSPVTLVEVTQTELRQEVALFGTSVPWRKVELSPRVAGLATAVLVDAGTWVKPGDPVLELEARLADIEIEVAQARVAAAQARRRDATRKRDELKRLQKDRHASQTAIDSAVAELEIANAELAREQAELARARELRDRHSLRAPFAGMVIAKHVEVGQWIQQDDAVIELLELDTLRVRATLPQRHFPQVTAGAVARVRFDALPDRTFEGQVFARVASADDSSRSFPLLIDIDNRDHLLAPGMSARVWVELVQGDVPALTVPRDAVIARSNGERLVWRVRDEAGGLKAFPVRIETGRAQGELIELLNSELAVGDRVVLLGNERLRPGQAVVDRTGSTPLAVK